MHLKHKYHVCYIITLSHIQEIQGIKYHHCPMQQKQPIGTTLSKKSKQLSQRTIMNKEYQSLMNIYDMMKDQLSALQRQEVKIINCIRTMKNKPNTNALTQIKVSDNEDDDIVLVESHNGKNDKSQVEEEQHQKQMHGDYPSVKQSRGKQSRKQRTSAKKSKGSLANNSQQNNKEIKNEDEIYEDD